MKPLLFALLAMPLLAHTQNCLLGRPILIDSLPCMEKALSLDGKGVQGRNAEEVMNIMCDHKPFARGTGLLVYTEPMGDITVTTVFNFGDQGCQKVIVSIIYPQEEIDKRDEHIDRFVKRFDEMYNARYNVMDRAQYSAYRKESHGVYAWEDRYSFILMDVVDRSSSHLLEITRNYQ